MLFDPLYESMWEDEEFKNISAKALAKKAAIRARINQMEEEGLF